MTQPPIYAVGDIHGQTAMLERALDLIRRDGGDQARIVFLGDLVDRGPDSRGVIERLQAGIAEGRPWQVLKGNHDRMFSRFVRGGVVHDARILSGLSWVNPRLGGLATLASYGLSVTEAAPLSEVFAGITGKVPQAHLAFVDNNPLFVQHHELLFVHAGVRPGVPLARQTEDDLIWIRDGFLTWAGAHPWLVVHGHTALEYPRHFGNRIDLDGGAGYGRDLHPAVFEGRNCWLLTESGRIALTA